MQPNNLESYLRYRAVIKLISEKEVTIKQITKETKIPQTTVYNIIRAFLNAKAIRVSSFSLDDRTNRTRAFKVNLNEIKKYL